MRLVHALKRRWSLTLAIALALLATASWARADDLNAGTSSRSERKKALASIPLSKLSPADRAKVKEVLGDISIYRRLPVEVVPCDPEFFLFLVNRPDAVVSIWEALGLSDVRVEQVGKNTYKADDGHGTTANVEYLYRSHDCHLVLAEGHYQGPLFKRNVSGRCLMMLRSGYVRETDGNYYVTNRMDVFCNLDNLGIEVIAKTVNPVMGKVIDRNFTEISMFVAGLNRKAGHDPVWCREMAEKLVDVHPAVRDEFTRITTKLAQAIRQASAVEPKGE